MTFAYFFELGDLNTFSFAAPALIKYWHLPIATISFIASATFFGLFLGAVGGRWLADRMGRKRSLIYAIACYSFFSLLNALAWDPISLGVMRLLTDIRTVTLRVHARIVSHRGACLRDRPDLWCRSPG